MEEIIISFDCKVNLIGSSLGGYYAIYLSYKYDLKAVLLNPAVSPVKTVKKILNENPNYYEGYNFILKNEHIDMLKKFKTINKDPKNLLTLLQTGDELLDFNEAKEHLKDSNLIIHQGGSHFFDELESYFETIDDFFQGK